jgi:hypothetical protein
MGWEYTLVDAGWDRQIGYDALKELVEYARPKNVKILVWYNSPASGTPSAARRAIACSIAATRRAELQRIKDLGVAGVKVDFFAGDAQSTIAYYHDILEDTARIGLAANFPRRHIAARLAAHLAESHDHGSRARHGIQHLRAAQCRELADARCDAAVRAQCVRSDGLHARRARSASATSIERRTSAAFELATSVLFTSGIQHFAEIPQGLAKAPSTCAISSSRCQ